MSRSGSAWWRPWPAGRRSSPGGEVRCPSCWPTNPPASSWTPLTPPSMLSPSPHLLTGARSAAKPRSASGSTGWLMPTSPCTGRGSVLHGVPHDPQQVDQVVGVLLLHGQDVFDHAASGGVAVAQPADDLLVGRDGHPFGN